MYSIIKREELQNNSSYPIIVDYEQELQALWREHLKSTKSDVLCESCNLQVEWWKDPNVKVRIHTAKVYTNEKYCECPGSEPGKIIVDPRAHLPGCKFRKVKTVDTAVVNEEHFGGYSLGVSTN